MHIFEIVQRVHAEDKEDNTDSPLLVSPIVSVHSVDAYVILTWFLILLALGPNFST